MAVIEASVAGGEANAGASWVGGVAPGENDDVVLGAASGSITISVAPTWKSVESVEGYKGTLKQNAAIAITLKGKNAAGWSWRWQGGTFTRGAASTQTILESSTAGNYKIRGGGQKLGNLKLVGSTSAVVLIFEDAVKAGEVKLEGGKIEANGFNTEWENGYATATAKTKILNIEGITVKITNTGTIWNIAGSGFTLEATTSTIEITDTSATSKTVKPGELTTYGTILFTPTGAAKLKIEESFTCKAIGYVAGEGTAKKLVFKEGITMTVSEFVATSGVVMGAALRATIWESSVAGKAFSIKGTGGICSADYLSLKDSHASGGTFYAGAHGTNTSGNEGWTFQTYHAQTLTVTQASAATRVTSPTRILSPTQAQSPTLGPTIAFRKLTATQAQSAVKVASPTRALSATQAQAVVRLAGPGRVLSATQAQAALKATALGRTLSVTQATAIPSGAVLPRSIAAHLTATQGSTASKLGTPTKTLLAGQGSLAVRMTLVNRALATTVVSSSVLVREGARTMTITQSSSAARIVALARALLVGQGSTATQVGQIVPLFVIAQPSSATKVVNVTRALSASGGQSATRITVPARTLAAEQGQSASKVDGKALSAALVAEQGSSASRLTRPGRVLSVTQGQLGLMARSPSRHLTVGQPQHIVLARSLTVALTLAQASSVSYERRIGKPIPAVQGSATTLRKQITRALPLVGQGQEASVVGKLVITFLPGKLVSTVVWEGATSDTATGVSSSSTPSVILTSTSESSAETSSVTPDLLIESTVD